MVFFLKFWFFLSNGSKTKNFLKKVKFSSFYVEGRLQYSCKKIQKVVILALKLVFLMILNDVKKKKTNYIAKLSIPLLEWVHTIIPILGEIMSFKHFNGILKWILNVTKTFIFTHKESSFDLDFFSVSTVFFARKSDIIY